MIFSIAIMTVALVVSVFVWGMIYAQRRKDPVNRALRLFILMQSGWLLSELLFFSPQSVGQEPLWQRITALFWITIGFWFLHAVYRVINRRNDWLYYLTLALSGCSLVVFWFTDLGVTGFERHPWGVADTPGPLHTPVITSIGAIGGVAGLVLLALARRETRDRDLRRAYTLLLAGGVGAIVLTWVFNALVPVLLQARSTPQIGAATLAVICPFLYGAVVRYDFLRPDLDEVATELFEDSPEGLVLIDADGRIHRTNGAAQRLLGLSNMRGQSIESVLTGVVSDKDFANRLHRIDNAEHTRVLSISQATHLRRTTIRGRILVLRDVTEREEASRILRRSRDEAKHEVEQRLKELEEAQKVGVIGTLAGGIAHDFNNLLGVVQGFTSMTYGDLPAGHPAREKLTAVLDATVNAQELVQQILAFSRREPPRKRAIASHWAVDEALKLLEVSLPATISIERHIAEDAGTVMADQQQLEQVLLNLCTNAYQAMGAQGGKLVITLEALEVDMPFAHDHAPLQPGPHIRLSVQDSGPGMDADTLSHIFEPFYSTRNGPEGTGLGLSTARLIVRDHGGEITVESTPASGTTFHVYLPAVSP